MTARFQHYRMTDRGAGQVGTPLNADELNRRWQDIDSRINALESSSLSTTALVNETLAKGLKGIADAMALITGGAVPVNGVDGQVLAWSGLVYLWRSLQAVDITDLQSILDLKADAASPVFTGVVDLDGASSVLVPTAASGDSSTKAANTAWVIARLAELVGSATPETLNTLQEIADALGDDPNFSATVLALIAQATDTSRGTAELATNAEVLAGSNNTNIITPAGLQSRIATTAQFLANTAGYLLSTDQVNAAGVFQTLTDASTIAFNMALGMNASVTLGGNRTLGNPTNPIVGRTGCIRVYQPASGGPRTLGYGTQWQTDSGSFPVLSTGANAKDLIFYFVESATTFIITGIRKAVVH